MGISHVRRRKRLPSSGQGKRLRPPNRRGRCVWLMTACLLFLSPCAGPPKQPMGEPDYRKLLDADIENLEVRFGWWKDRERERRFAEDFKTLLTKTILDHHRNRGGSLTITNAAFFEAFDTAIVDVLQEGRIDHLTRSGAVDLSSGFWNWRQGNRLHARFTLEEQEDYLSVSLLVRRPDASGARVTVRRIEDGYKVYESREFPIGSFKKFRVRINGMLSYTKHLETVQVFFTAPDEVVKTIYRCFHRDRPQQTVFYREYPLSVEKLDADFKQTEGRVSVTDRDFLRNYGNDIRRLYYEIGLLKPKSSPAERVDALVRILIDAREQTVLSKLKRMDFPTGIEVRVEERTYTAPLMHLEIRGPAHRLILVSPRSMEVVYDSGRVGAGPMSRAQQDRFNFGSRLPDLWRNQNQRLFISVFALNKAKAYQRGEPDPSDDVVFKQTLEDMKRAGNYFSRQRVRINSVSYVLMMDESDITGFLARLEESPGEELQAVLPPVPEVPLHRQTQWNLTRVQEKELTFIRDHDLVYYVVEKSDCAGADPLDAIRRRLRTAFPDAYTYSLVFSGFRNEHIQPGMLLPIPRPEDERRISDRELKDMVTAACADSGYDYPELVFAIVWNECRAGRDNFFRFEPGRLDKVKRLADHMSPEDRLRYEEVYGRFSYLLAGSWGPGHILYENAWRLGFRGSPGELALPEVNIPLIVAYLKTNGIGRTSTLDHISRIYNGPGYARNGYHTRLRKNLLRAEEQFRT